MSYQETCHDCDTPIQSYGYIFCTDCLVKHLKCQMCNVSISVDEDQQSKGQQICKKCYPPVKDWEDKQEKRFLEEQRIKEEKRKFYSSKSDSELESMWQSSASEIQMYALASWDKSKTPEESKRLHDLAVQAQERQSEIQSEITRRARN